MDNQNNNPNNRNQNNRNNNRNNKQGLPFIILVTLVTMVMVMALFQFQGAGSDNEISYNEFLKKVDDGKVEEVVIQSSRIVITEKKEKGQKIAKEKGMSCDEADYEDFVRTHAQKYLMDEDAVRNTTPFLAMLVEKYAKLVIAEQIARTEASMKEV